MLNICVHVMYLAEWEKAEREKSKIAHDKCIVYSERQPLLIDNIIGNLKTHCEFDCF
jgi:hypothetical protein